MVEYFLLPNLTPKRVRAIVIGQQISSYIVVKVELELNENKN